MSRLNTLAALALTGASLTLAMPAQASAAGQATAGASAATTTTASTQTSAPADAVMVGGAPMLPTQTIVANAEKASTLTKLVAALKAADLTETLSGPGPYTVFAPTDDAFGRVPAATLAAFMAPANKAQLTKLLTYHVVRGELTAQKLLEQVKAAGGTLSLPTVEGEPLTATLMGGGIVLSDVQGNKSYITQYDVKQSNGVVHTVNGVLIPTIGEMVAAAAAVPADAQPQK